MWPTLIDDAVIPTSVLPFGAAPPPPGTGAPDAGAGEPPDGAADPELWPPPAAGPPPGVGDAADRAAPDDDFPAELAAGDAAPDPEAPPAAPGWAAAGAEEPASVGWATPACSGAAGSAALGAEVAGFEPFPLFNARSSSSRCEEPPLQAALTTSTTLSTMKPRGNLILPPP